MCVDMRVDMSVRFCPVVGRYRDDLVKLDVLNIYQVSNNIDKYLSSIYIYPVCNDIDK